MYELNLRTAVPAALTQDTHEMMKRVIEIAPYSSLCSGTVDQTENGYKVHVEVRSAVGLLVGWGEASQLSEALKEAEKKLKKEIVQWRKMRFEDHVVDTMAVVS